jgi:hypothetical protein
MPDEPSSTPEPSPSDTEKRFWEEHAKRTKGILDQWFDEKVKTVQSQRGTGRNTLPKVLADFFFPVEK